MSRVRSNSVGATPINTSNILNLSLNTRVGSSLALPQTVAQDIESITPSIQQTDPPVDEIWQQKILLTFDGGGIRGYASLLMLAELMICIGHAERNHAEPHVTSFAPFKRPPEVRTHDTGLVRDEGSYLSEFLPCHYFDYIVGTSTGGLIATMLSRWRMSVADCLRQYEIVGERVFGNPRKISILGWPHDKHHKAPLIQAINDITTQRTPSVREDSGEKFLMFPAPSDLCRVAVVAIQKGKNRTEEGVITQDGPYLFRSYKPDNIDPLWPPLNYGVSINREIWEVCRATTAAPFYFKSQIIGDEEYCDGAAEANNPTIIAMDEVSRLHKNQLRLVASFGTGKPLKESIFRRQGHQLDLGPAIDRAHRLFKTATANLTDCENTHNEVRNRLHLLRETDAHFDYYRFNVDEGLGKVKLDEWKQRRDDGDDGKCTTLEYIRKCTHRQLELSTTRELLRTLANKLVEQRRCRATRHTAHWERFACCTTYRCQDERCTEEIDGKGPSFTTRDRMSHHLTTMHTPPSTQRWTTESLNARLDECRIMPEFPAGPY